MRLLSGILLFAIFPCCNPKPEQKRDFVDPKTAAKRQGVDSAVTDLAKGKFTWGQRMPVPLAYYAEEVFLKDYQLEVTVEEENPYLNFCGTGLPGFYDIRISAYNRALDSLLALRFGNDIKSRIETSAQSLQEKYPDRYTDEPSAVFPGGDEALFAALRKNIRYPAGAKKDSIQGTVFLQLQIDSTGKVTDAIVLKTLRSDLDSVAIAGAKSLPPFQPAFRRGRNESSTLLQPVKFVLQ